ncbi:MAG TPA: hypothetical protein DCP91_07320 [Eggerthellaceae bacterium]|nr:hypothetical protein [Eggerthellaceae bacterium]
MTIRGNKTMRSGRFAASFCDAVGLRGYFTCVAVLLVVGLALACAMLASPSRAYARYNQYADSLPAMQDLGTYGKPIYGNQLPDGNYSVVGRTSSRMCIMYLNPNDAEARDSKEQAILMVKNGQMTAVFYLSSAYTHLYMGTMEEAAEHTNADGTNASAYIAGDPDSGYVPHLFAIPVDALNTPFTMSTYSGGDKGVEKGKWYTRQAVFIMTDAQLQEAIAAAQQQGSGDDGGSSGSQNSGEAQKSDGSQNPGGGNGGGNENGGNSGNGNAGDDNGNGNGGDDNNNDDNNGNNGNGNDDDNGNGNGGNDNDNGSKDNDDDKSKQSDNRQPALNESNVGSGGAAGGAASRSGGDAPGGGNDSGDGGSDEGEGGSGGAGARGGTGAAVHGVRMNIVDPFVEIEAVERPDVPVEVEKPLLTPEQIIAIVLGLLFVGGIALRAALFSHGFERAIGPPKAPAGS